MPKLSDLQKDQNQMHLVNDTEDMMSFTKQPSTSKISRRTFGTLSLKASVGIAAGVAAINTVTPMAMAASAPTTATASQAQLESLCADIQQTAGLHATMKKHVTETEGKLDKRLPTALRHADMFRNKVVDMAKSLQPLQPQTLAQVEAKRSALRVANTLAIAA